MKLFLFFCSILFSAFLYATPTLEVQTSDEGGVRWLHFIVNDVQQVYGVDLEIEFDNQVISPVDINERQSGIQVSRGNLFGDSGHEISNSVDVRRGVARIASGILHPAEPVSGKGTVAVIGFKHKENNTVGKVQVSRLQLGDKKGGLTEISYEKIVLVEPAVSKGHSVQDLSKAVLPEAYGGMNKNDVSSAIYLLIGLMAFAILLLIALLVRKPLKAV